MAAALLEMRRVLRPGGELRFLEHGRAPDPKVAKWQRRLDPIQKRFAGGCHLSRPIEELVRASGLVIESVEQYAMKGPKVAAWMYSGVARKL